MQILLDIGIIITYTLLNIFLFYKVYENFSNKEEIYLDKKIILIISILLGLSTGILIKCSDLLPFHTIINILIYFIALKYFFKLPNLISISLILTIGIVDLLGELFCVLILKELFNLSVTQIQENSIYHFICLISVAIVTGLIIFLITKCKNTIETIKENFNNKYLIMFIQILALTILPNLLLITSNTYNFSNYFLILTTLEIIITTTVMFSYIVNLTRKDRLETNIKALEINNKNMITMVDGVRSLKHDYNNIFQIINGYVSTKNYDDLDKYVKSILQECNTLNNLSIINKDTFDDGGIYGIVGSKHFLALESKIKFDIDSSIKYKELNFNIAELSRILGILLDNAIEATTKANNKYIRYEAKFIPKKGATVIKIANTYDTNIKIDTEKIYNKGVSSKKVKSGLGLWEVKKFIKRHKNSQIYATLEKDLFVQTIIIE